MYFSGINIKKKLEKIRKKSFFNFFFLKFKNTKNNLMIRYLIFVFFLFNSFNAKSQKVWRLKDCIDYALKNNILIKQSKLNTEISKSDEKFSKLNLLPRINSNGRFNRNQGRSIDPFSNSFIEQVNSNMNFSYNSDIVLFNGLSKINQIKKSKNSIKINEYETENIKNNLISSIALNYLQILFNIELCTLANNQLDLSLEQELRLSNLYNEGLISYGELLNIQSQIALDEKQITDSKNQLQLSKLQLAQLLELDDFMQLNIIFDSISIPPVILIDDLENDYKIALKNQSLIKSGNLKIINSKIDYKIAKSNIYPSLSVGLSAGTIFSDNVSYLFSFWDQIRNNRNSVIYLSLNIPIFNNWINKNNIQKSKINIENTILSVQTDKNNLKQNMQIAFNDQLSAYKNYIASEKVLISNQEEYNYIIEKYELGIVNSFEFNQIKNKLINSKSDLLQAKYDFIFKIQLYKFYSNLNFSL
ncbi:MAG: hypothetical protein CMD07_03615 [Flavobacteriales bacterium]|nr:hypothetical protein [Flavobacteriales bacterium]